MDNGAPLDIDQILAKYSDTVYKIALSQTKRQADAEDVFQEVFLRLVRRGREFESEEHRKAWLIRVTLNCCKNNFAFWRKSPGRLTEDIPWNPPPEYGILQEVMALPPKHRIAVHLFYYEDLPVTQIARIMKCKESTVKSYLFRGRQMLKEKLAEEALHGQPV